MFLGWYKKFFETKREEQYARNRGRVSEVIELVELERKEFATFAASVVDKLAREAPTTLSDSLIRALEKIKAVPAANTKQAAANSTPGKSPMSSEAGM
jgi:hypothetical protein